MSIHHHGWWRAQRTDRTVGWHCTLPGWGCRGGRPRARQSRGKRGVGPVDVSGRGRGTPNAPCLMGMWQAKGRARLGLRSSPPPGWGRGGGSTTPPTKGLHVHVPQRTACRALAPPHASLTAIAGPPGGCMHSALRENSAAAHAHTLAKPGAWHACAGRTRPAAGRQL